MIAKSTKKTLVYHRDDGVIILRPRPVEPRIERARMKR